MAEFDQPRPPTFTPFEPANRSAPAESTPLIPLTKVVGDHQKVQLHETRRAMFSASMMQALLMHNGANASESNLARMASMAVRCADLLLAELDKAQR